MIDNKKSPCNNCIHRNICKYSHRFSGFASSISNVANNFDKKDDPFEVDIHCRFFFIDKNEYYQPHFGTRSKE